MPICPRCGAEVPEEVSVCRACGAFIPTMKKVEVRSAPSEQTCPRCGDPVNPTDTVCAKCGFTLRDATGYLVTSRDENTVRPSAASVNRFGQVTSDQLLAADRPTHAQVRSRGVRREGYWGIIVAFIVIAALAGVAYLGIQTEGFGVLGFYDKPTDLPGAPEAPAVGVVPVDAQRQDASNSRVASITVREGLNSYSWEELRGIARELSACEGRAAALSLAASYNLVAGTSIRDDTTTLTLTDGTQVTLRLADIYHDDLASGTGKAGLTFICCDTTAYALPMRRYSTNDGGWERSELRATLNADVLSLFPDELRSAIVPVLKLTNNTGHTADPAAVKATADLLWIPSTVEVSGPVAYYWGSDPTNTENYNNVLNAEGYQYACYDQMHLAAEQPDGRLVMYYQGAPIGWWQRSSSVSTTMRYRSTTAEGDPSMFTEATATLGVCFGFCL